ncbi:trypsin-like peptidase domain-containing protein [Streptomyces sp. AV19]|uniref:trypsin-like serine peptidase n=1 Tax=Streptomyces sp. AV19 TaxID=2793068 RepID=UPI0018FED627|nr:serine protease [Streptomyces sp. AV19]MBH1934659.1 trypsin-like peptidase domain-containing protein [Streptomyces sp. AV19]MDG4530805.1 serine protease [Streptomyces sp. AV19]
MRARSAGPGKAGYTVLFATVLALAVLGLLVAGRGSATDGSLAQGESSGHYAEPEEAGDRTADAMASAVRTEPGTARAAAGHGSARRTEPLPRSEPLEAAPTEPSPAIGPLFYADDSGQAGQSGQSGQDEPPGHGCTAGVVHSERGDLLVTAAHCVHTDGFHTDIAFAPGYHDGVAPYGIWVPTSIDVAPEWIADRDEDHDVAFLRVRQVGSDTPVEQVTGAERIAFHPPTDKPARVLGYPGDGERPLGCQNTTRAEGRTQLRFDCRGMPGGTSGSPLLTDVDAATGLGTVVGVLGGKDEGGDDETSYSSYFGDAVEELYGRVVR